MEFINKIIHGDCLDVMMEIQDKSIDLLLTDPPYSSGARQTKQLRAKKTMVRGKKWENEWIGSDNMSTIGFMFFMRALCLISMDKLKNGSHFYSFIDWRNYPILCSTLETGGLRINDMIVWDKKHFGMGYHFRNQHELIIFASKGKPRKPNRHDIANVITSKRPLSDIHPTEKPIDILSLFIEMSTNENDLILDPFSGSGTTAIACHRLNRRFICIEKEKKYVDLSRRRLDEEQAKMKLF